MTAYRVRDAHPRHASHGLLVELWLRLRIWLSETRLKGLQEIEIAAWQNAGELSNEVAALKASVARMRAMVRECGR